MCFSHLLKINSTNHLKEYLVPSLRKYIEIFRHKGTLYLSLTFKYLRGKNVYTYTQREEGADKVNGVKC